jgi:hypothetical protein
VTVKQTKSRWIAGVALLTIVLSACNPVPAPEPEAAPDTVLEPDTTAAPSTEDNLPADDVILQSVLGQVETLDLCDGFFDPVMAESESQVYRLDNQALVELNCAVAAYQGVYAYGVYQADGSFQPLALDVFYPNETGQFERASEPTVGGLTSFQPEQRLLTVFSKARGIGDCGSFAEYRWTGRELELETFRYKECSDSSEEFVDPADYPQIYP